MELISRIYRWKLWRRITSSEILPEHVVLVLSESDVIPTGIDKIRSFIMWCDELKIKIVTVYTSLIEADEEASLNICKQISKQIHESLSDLPVEIYMYSKAEKDVIHIVNIEKQTNPQKNPCMKVNISIGYSGKYELTNAIRNVLKKVESGDLEPDEIDESVIESHLLIKYDPDLVIRAGGKRLTDFLIWQSVYSELYFTDVNWSDFREIDLLRAIRDFQKRQRRYGK